MKYEPLAIDLETGRPLVVINLEILNSISSYTSNLYLQQVDLSLGINQEAFLLDVVTVELLQRLLAASADIADSILKSGAIPNFSKDFPKSLREAIQKIDVNQVDSRMLSPVEFESDKNKV